MYHVCMQMWPEMATCSRCMAQMDTYGDHALLCCEDPNYTRLAPLSPRPQDPWHTPAAGWRVPSSRAPNMHFDCDDNPESGRGSGPTKPEDILLYVRHGSHRCYVDLVGVSPARDGWRDALMHCRAWSRASGTSMSATALMASTSSPSAFCPFGPLAQHLRSSLTTLASVMTPMCRFPSGNCMLGFIVGYPLLSCGA